MLVKYWICDICDVKIDKAVDLVRVKAVSGLYNNELAIYDECKDIEMCKECARERDLI